MSNGLHKSKIDYLAESESLIGRPGYVLNIVTGCKHYMTDRCKVPCYARYLVHWRLRTHPAYPYGFEPTFHPERVVAIGGKPKLIFLNDMGDVGGDWTWKAQGQDVCGDPMPDTLWTPEQIARNMAHFATLNPQHIILLLTKRPEWYGLLLRNLPDNLWLGYTATNNEELRARAGQMPCVTNYWISCEPWLDPEPPKIGPYFKGWLVIGGQSRPDRPVSAATQAWVRDHMDHPGDMRLYCKRNAGLSDWTEEYPESWRIK